MGFRRCVSIPPAVLVASPQHSVCMLMTGTTSQTKLTEDELVARMSAIALKNASLTAAHARASADEASFHAREAHAARRAADERASRSAMLGERERNAQRKMRALQGREWDKEKGEQNVDLERDGRELASSRRGAYGGLTGRPRTDRSPRRHQLGTARTVAKGAADDPACSPRFDRGARKGRDSAGLRPVAQRPANGGSKAVTGRGQGGRPPVEKGVSAPKQPPQSSDFPSLPQPSSEPSLNAQQAPIKLSFPLPLAADLYKSAHVSARQTGSGGQAGTREVGEAEARIASPPVGPKKSWADQVEGAVGAA